MSNEREVHSAEEASPPFDGYDRLKVRDLNKSLAGRSQDELETIERYERANESRVPVLDKLRWMRGSQPVPGYDQLTQDEILGLLETADLTTIKKIRSYERKFANRRDVLEEVARAHRRGRDSRPAQVPPAYAPQSAVKK